MNTNDQSYMTVRNQHPKAKKNIEEKPGKKLLFH